ncbi:MAG: archease [Candidatus Nanosalina sp.]
MPYDILDHPADAKFRATGETKEEAFSEAVEAFSEIVGGDSGMYTHSVEVKSEGLDPLLFDFLDELIFLQDTENVVVSHASELKMEELEDGWKLSAEIMVDDITPEVHKLDVKGPTYSEMEVEYDEERSAWVTQAVIDI